jgi:hypothetical protein
MITGASESGVGSGLYPRGGARRRKKWDLFSWKPVVREEQHVVRLTGPSFEGSELRRKPPPLKKEERGRLEVELYRFRKCC